MLLSKLETSKSVDFLESNTLWKVTLNNGIDIYESEPSGWLKLKECCDQEGFFVDRLYVMFRDNVYTAPKADSYFVAKSVLAGLGGGKSTNFYLVGYVIDDILRVDKIRIPEIVLETTEIRDIERYKKCLINCQKLEN